MDMLHGRTVWPHVAHHTHGIDATLRSGVVSSNQLVGLVDMAAQRLQLAEPVAALKFNAGGGITDTRREQEVLQAVGAGARAAGIDDNYVMNVFRDQIEATVALEHSRFAQWRVVAAKLPDCVPELSACRAIIDTFNRIMVTEMALQWNSLRSAGCAAQLEDARRTVTDARRLDSSVQDALAHATRRYCR